jgi:DinB superfamily
MTQLDLALQQLEFARGYTLRLVENVPDQEWFQQPHEGITHIGWQIGHLTMADYRLGMERLRGVRPEDEILLPQHVLSLFRGGTTPDADPARYPSPQELRGYLKRVREQMLSEVRRLPEEEWSQPLLPTHPIAKTKLESLFWCGSHELVHAGQIALLRRLLGHRPLW